MRGVQRGGDPPLLLAGIWPNTAQAAVSAHLHEVSYKDSSLALGMTDSRAGGGVDGVLEGGGVEGAMGDRLDLSVRVDDGRDRQ